MGRTVLLAIAYLICFLGTVASQSAGFNDDLAATFQKTGRFTCSYGRSTVTPGPVTSAFVTAITPQSARVSWREPANGGCYQYVEVKLVGDGRSDVRRSFRLAEVLTDLKPGAEYTVTLTPYSLAGPGPPVTLQLNTQRPSVRWTCTPDQRRPPFAVKNLVVSTDFAPGALRIQFSPAVLGTCATKFQIRIFDAGGNRPFFDVSTPYIDPVVAGLRINRKYVVQVAASNAQGWSPVARAEVTLGAFTPKAPVGLQLPAKPQPTPKPAAVPQPSAPPPSSSAKACTPGGSTAPGAVEEFKAAAGKDPSTQVVLSWQPPTQGSCPTTYVVEGFVGSSNTPALKEPPLAASITSKTLDQLQPGTQYKFVVTAVAADGRRSAVSTTTLVTGSSNCAVRTEAPQPPSNIVVVAAAQSLKFSWRPAATGPCTTAYYVEMYERTIRVFRQELTSQSVNITNLKPSTTYLYRLVSANEAGDSDDITDTISTVAKDSETTTIAAASRGGSRATQPVIPGLPLPSSLATTTPSQNCSPTQTPGKVSNLTAVAQANGVVLVRFNPPRNQACVAAYQATAQTDSDDAPQTLLLPLQDVQDGDGGAVWRFAGRPNTPYTFFIAPVGVNTRAGPISIVSTPGGAGSG